MTVLQPETMVDNRYRVIQRIGAGGMADVYLADDRHLGRKVALKVMHERFATDRQFVQRFEREAQAAAGLQHRNIVGVYDRGQVGDTYYIAMEYLPGRSLKDVINAMGALDPKLAIHLALQILDAARFAHSRGIVHRDIKPQNVMIDDEWNVKVADFGIAHDPVAGDITQTGQMIGTAHYISPEQAQGKPVSAASDFYSVGVVLFEMLTGRVPFIGESSVQIALKHINEKPARPSSVALAVPPALDAVVLKAMAKSPVERYASADEFTQALENAKNALGVEQGKTEIRTAPTAVMAGAGAAAGAAVAAAVTNKAVDDEAAKKQKRRRNWLIAGGVVAALAIAGVLWFVLAGGKQTVPNVVGRSAADAQSRLAAAGFKSRIFNLQNKAPVGEVFSQSPSGGVKAKKDSTVILNVSAGPGTVPMPSVAGLGRNDAENKLKGLGLKVVIKREYSNDIARGIATRTTPAAGEQADRGSAVDLYISKGAKQVAVPNVVGINVDDAKTQLEDAGFTVETSQEDSAEAEGQVLKQTPAAAGKADDGSTVKLTVASGRNALPDVTGLTEPDATKQLEDAGFKVNVQEIDVTNVNDDGSVVSESPTGGGSVKVGTTVTIEVGVFTAAP